MQLVLARFIAEGRLAAHVRRMRTLYRDRRAALLAALARHAGDVLDVGEPPDAGLHFAVRLKVDVDDVEVSGMVRQHGVFAAPLSSYYARPRARAGSCSALRTRRWPSGTGRATPGGGDSGRRRPPSAGAGVTLLHLDAFEGQRHLLHDHAAVHGVERRVARVTGHARRKRQVMTTAGRLPAAAR